VGMIPCDDSSARKQRLGHVTKQGNSLLRFLLVEAAQAAARVHPPGLATNRVPVRFPRLPGACQGLMPKFALVMLQVPCT
jgi:hypothetical protein